MDADQLRRYLEFYQDLKITTLYRPAIQHAPPALESAPAAQPTLAPLPAASLPPLAPDGDTLLKILQDIGDCRRCVLHEGRNRIVFGVGNERAPLVFVGGTETGFESDLNEAVLALRTGETIPVPRATKREVADRIFDEALRLRLKLHAAHGR